MHIYIIAGPESESYTSINNNNIPSVIPQVGFGITYKYGRGKYYKVKSILKPKCYQVEERESKNY